MSRHVRMSSILRLNTDPRLALFATDAVADARAVDVDELEFPDLLGATVWNVTSITLGKAKSQAAGPAAEFNSLDGCQGDGTR